MARLKCDVLHCEHERRRGQRLCGRCYGKLPGAIRVGITEAHHQRRTGAWNQLRREAAAYLGLTIVTAAMASLPRQPSSQQVYEQTARRMGERS